MDLLQAWQLVVLPFIAATLGAWFTAHFSLRRFFREKEWERKTQAYTAIFERRCAVIAKWLAERSSSC